MKKCPKCSSNLAPSSYDNIRIHRCGNCNGVFIPEIGLNGILRRTKRDENDLKSEADREITEDTRHPIKCPVCLRPMDKRPIDSRHTRLLMDRCRRCKGVWLDAGEIAIYQLAFATSERGVESKENQRRLQELESDPDRKKRFEEALAAMPERFPGEADEDDSILDGIILELIKRL